MNVSLLQLNMRITRCRHWCAVIIGAVLVLVVGGIFPADAMALPYIWKPLRIGAGGWLTGIDIADDGTKVVRADVYGAYMWSQRNKRWRQLVTVKSMPSNDIVEDAGEGVYEIRIAQSNPRIFYMYYNNNVFKSTDKGRHWRRTTYRTENADPNDNFRTYGPKMAVDPGNPDVVYVGSPKKGVFVTSDGGNTWSEVATVPLGALENNVPVGHPGMFFDATSGRVHGKTKVIYLPSWGNGVWRSDDAGSTWKQISGTVEGGPLKIRRAAVGTDGSYFVTTHEDGRNKLMAFAKGVWNEIGPVSDDPIHSVSPDPANAQHLVIGTGGGNINESFDHGKTWTGFLASYWPPPGVRRVATDIPWLAWTKEDYMSNGDMQFDPVTGELFFAEGIGVWKATLPGDYKAFDWISQSRGIEELVANVVVAPPNGKPVVASWDRPVFHVENPNVYPSAHGPDNKFSIVHGFDIDWASTNPGYLAALINLGEREQSGYSTDGGRTWSPFTSYPPRAISGYGGCIAASTPTNLVWVPSNRNPPYYTRDGGKSWTKINIPGIPDDTPGWGWAYYLKRHIIAADRVLANTFYLYHTPNGVYRSNDGGGNWEMVHTGELTPFSGYNAKMKSVPGWGGHLFFTAGSSGGPSEPHPEPSRRFLHSVDGGRTWRAIANVLEVYDFGFGKQAPGATYPTIYLAGWVNSEWGIWESNNEGRTWRKIGDFPRKSIAKVTTIDGDKTIYGRVYVGMGGNAYAYGKRKSNQGN